MFKLIWKNKVNPILTKSTKQARYGIREKTKIVKTSRKIHQIPKMKNQSLCRRIVNKET